MSLFDQLREASNFDDVVGAPTQNSNAAGVSLIQQKGNPVFTSQIDLNISVVYSGAQITQATGAIDERVLQIIPANLIADLKNQLPVFLFGNADFAGGYKRATTLASSYGWRFHSSRIVDKVSEIYSLAPSIIGVTDLDSSASIDLNSMAQLLNRVSVGDMVQTYYYVGAVSAGIIPVYFAEILVKCPQVAYGTLLDSISSDTFVVNGFRYTVQDITKIAQFDNAFQMTRQSLFGKLATDTINPNSMKLPTNQQDGIIDVPAVIPVDKNMILSTYLNYDCPTFTLSLFIKNVQKIKA